MKKLLIIFVCLLFCTVAVHADNNNQGRSTGFFDGSRLHKAGDSDSHNDSQGDLSYFIKKLWYGITMYQYIDQKMKEQNVVGASIAVVHHNDILFMHGFGYADKEKNIPVTPFTLFRVGSISKLFTGIATMQLVEQGLIDLDAPLNTYLPDFSVKSRFPGNDPITVRMLMTHQSGLPEEKLKNNISYSYPHEDYRQFVDYLKDEHVAYPPQHISSYSNLAVSLLGSVIEKVSGTDFNTYVYQHVLNPVRMVASSFIEKDYFLNPLMSKGYLPTGEAYDFYYPSTIPAGGLLSSSLEMSRFMKMILNGGESYGHTILQETTLDLMFEQQNKDIALDFPTEKGRKWGLSWMLSHPNNLFDYAGDYIGHGGYSPPFCSELHLLPEHGLGVVVTVNTEPSEEANTAISSDIADEALVKALEIMKGVKKPDVSPLAEETSLTDQMKHHMIGTYAVRGVGTLTIKEDDGLVIHTSGGSIVNMIPHVDNWFSLKTDGQRIDGVRLSVQLLHNEKVLVMESRTPKGGISRKPHGVAYDTTKEIPQVWKNRFGEYVFINFDDPNTLPPAFRVVSQDNVMYLQGETSMSALLPVSDNEIVVRGMGRGCNEVAQIKNIEGEEYITYSGHIYKKKEDRTAKPRTLQAPKKLEDVKKYF